MKYAYIHKETGRISRERISQEYIPMNGALLRGDEYPKLYKELLKSPGFKADQGYRGSRYKGLFKVPTLIIGD